jgi:hypothetical protein
MKRFVIIFWDEHAALYQMIKLLRDEREGKLSEDSIFMFQSLVHIEDQTFEVALEAASGELCALTYEMLKSLLTLHGKHSIGDSTSLVSVFHYMREPRMLRNLILRKCSIDDKRRFGILAPSRDIGQLYFLPFPLSISFSFLSPYLHFRNYPHDTTTQSLLHSQQIIDILMSVFGHRTFSPQKFI